MPGYQSNLSAALMQAGTIVAWERFGVELILSFIVVLTYLITMDKYTKWLGSSSLTIGAAYAACTFVSVLYSQQCYLNATNSSCYRCLI